MKWMNSQESRIDLLRESLKSLELNSEGDLKKNSSSMSWLELCEVKVGMEKLSAGEFDELEAQQVEEMGTSLETLLKGGYLRAETTGCEYDEDEQRNESGAATKDIITSAPRKIREEILKLASYFFEFGLQ